MSDEKVDLGDVGFDDTPETDATIKWVRRPVNTRTIRSTHEYKTGRDQYRERCAVQRNPDGSTGAPCIICTEPISYSLVYPHPLSWSLEHTVSVQDHPELLMDRNGWGSAHFSCNSMKGPDELPPDTGIPSEDWS
jgi:hypothetical protein